MAVNPQVLKFQNLTLPFLFNRYIKLFKMKNKILIALFLCSLYFLSGCSGDRTPQNGKDTVQNTYHTKDTTKGGDTSKAAGSDNGATGGTKTLKDTTKK